MTAKKPFGLWSSPLSALQVSQRLRFNDVQWDRSGRALVWLEGRSGQNVLVLQADGDARQDLTTGLAVQGGIGYGGGEFTLAPNTLVFAARDGRLYRRSLAADQPRPLTPPFGACASPTLSPDGRWVAYVFSDGKTDLLGMVDSQGQQWPLKLASGADFYMQPVWHPQGNQLAWIEWDHPNMPWDGTRLKLGHLDSQPPRLQEEQILAGDETTAVCQPQFSPNGQFMSYIEASGEWENLVLLDLGSGHKTILVQGDGFHLTQPAWVQGIRTYVWASSSQRLFYIRYFSGEAALWEVAVETGQSTPIDISPYTTLSQLDVSPIADEVAFIGSSPAIPARLVRWDGISCRTLSRSDPEGIPPAYFSSPQNLTWTSPEGSPVYGLYYPPTNPDFHAQGLPPAILHIHGGPTSQAISAYNPEIAYFTSRGYAWLEVNYRGSSGYGRTYRDALRQRWGDVDVVDAAGGAHALVERGLAHPQQLVIFGGSAGGYTVLNALIHYPEVFKAGVCQYGVSNLFLLDLETHKFEERYTASLVGELPAAAERYHAWSPIFHASHIRSPLAVFQGADDKVVPPSQSEAIVAALRGSGVPHFYRLYEGEGHGFRKNETIQDFLQQMELFLQQYVLFAP